MMPPQSSELSFLDDDQSTTSSQSTVDTSPIRGICKKHLQQSQVLRTSKYADIAQVNANQYDPTLIGLPQKIRNLIYQYIFANSIIHVSRRHRATVPSIKQVSNSHIMLWTPLTFRQDSKDYDHYETGRALSILSVSQRIRKEALPYYIEDSVFQLHGPAALCVDWIDGFCFEDRRLLREIRYSDPYEQLSLLAASLRKNAAREFSSGIVAEMARRGITLAIGVLRVRMVFKDGRVRWVVAVK